MAHKDRLKALIALGFGAVALLAATTPVMAHKDHDDHKRVEAVEEVADEEAVVEEDADSDDDDDDDDDDAQKNAVGGRSDKYGNPTFTNNVEADEDDEDDDDGVLGVGDDKPGVLGVGEDDDDDGN